MRFTLKYRGEELLSSGNSPARVQEKQILRAYFHEQLRHIWDTNNVLVQIPRRELPEGVKVPGDRYDVGTPVIIADLPLKGFMFAGTMYESRFIPLITARMEAQCGLSIRIGRPMKPGSIVYSGGDLA